MQHQTKPFRQTCTQYKLRPTCNYTFNVLPYSLGQNAQIFRSPHKIYKPSPRKIICGVEFLGACAFILSVFYVFL